MLSMEIFQFTGNSSFMHSGIFQFNAFWNIPVYSIQNQKILDVYTFVRHPYSTNLHMEDEDNSSIIIEKLQCIYSWHVIKCQKKKKYHSKISQYFSSTGLKGETKNMFIDEFLHNTAVDRAERNKIQKHQLQCLSTLYFLCFVMLGFNANLDSRRNMCSKQASIGEFVAAATPLQFCKKNF